MGAWAAADGGGKVRLGSWRGLVGGLLWAVAGGGRLAVGEVWRVSSPVARMGSVAMGVEVVGGSGVFGLSFWDFRI